MKKAMLFLLLIISFNSKVYALEYWTSYSTIVDWYSSYEGCPPAQADLNYWISVGNGKSSTNDLITLMRNAAIQNNDYRYKVCRCDSTGTAYWNLPSYQVSSNYYMVSGSCYLITPPPPVITTRIVTENQVISCGNGYSGTATANINYLETYQNYILIRREVLNTTYNKSNCVATVYTTEDVSTDIITNKACASNEVGSNGKNYDVYVQRTNSTYIKLPDGSRGSKVGSDLVFTSIQEKNCINIPELNQVVDPVDPLIPVKDTLLSELYISTSQVSKNDDLVNYLKALTAKGWKPEKQQSLHIIVNDLSTDSYNINKSSDVVFAFKTLIGERYGFILVDSLPKTLDKYIGRSGLTLSNIKDKKFLSSTIDQNQVITLTYLDMNQAKVKDMPPIIEVKFNLFTKPLDFLNFKSNDFLKK